MCDAGTFRVKKNTTNNNLKLSSLYNVIAYYVQRYGLLRYLDNPCAVLLCDSFVRISHLNIYVKRFYKDFLIFFKNFFRPK